MLRIRLDDAEFDALVRGRVARCWAQPADRDEAVAVELILADIGFTRMLYLIDRAIDDQDPHAS